MNANILKQAQNLAGAISIKRADLPKHLCCICIQTPWKEQHHIYPKHLGGPDDGPLIGICGDCHSNLHSHASAFLRNKVPETLPFTDDQQTELLIFSALLRIIIQAAIDQEDNVSPNQPRHVHLKVSHVMLQRMHKRKADLGYSNMEKYLLNLINRDLQS